MPKYWEGQGDEFRRRWWPPWRLQQTGVYLI
nr:MAG TPA: hypothetical protein [Caudoviricetes sp.]